MTQPVRLRGRVLAVLMFAVIVVCAASMRAGLPLRDVPTALPETWRGVLNGWVGDTSYSSGSYAFLNTEGEEPLSWAKRTITFRIDEELSAGEEAIILEAFVLTGDVTGHRFVFKGRTSFEPSTTNLHRAKSDVVVSVSSKAATDVFAGMPGDAVAVGFSLIENGVRTKGAVVLDGDATLRGRALQRVMMHEIGHVLGLAHTDDATQVMAAETNGAFPAKWGTGDLEGLRRLASASKP